MKNFAKYICLFLAIVGINISAWAGDVNIINNLTGCTAAAGQQTTITTSQQNSNVELLYTINAGKTGEGVTPSVALQYPGGERTELGYFASKWERVSGKTYRLRIFASSINGGTYGGYRDRNVVITINCPTGNQVYTLTYDANGGETTCLSGEDHEVGENFSLCATAPTRAGFTFGGWRYNSTNYSAGASFTMPDEDVTMVAQWTGDQYAITLNSNAGDVANGSANVRMGATAVTAFARVTNSAATILGYYTAARGGRRVLDAEGALQRNVPGYTTSSGEWIKAENTTLHAQYLYANYQTYCPRTLTFDKNGQSTATPWPDDQTGKSGFTPVRPGTNPAVAGQTFGGWYTTQECTGAEFNFATVTEDMTLYAKWTPTSTDVTVYANNGTDDYTVCPVAIGSSENCCYAPSYTGYTLDGFYTAEVGGVKVYNADGTMVMNVTNYTNGTGWSHTNPTATLYAHWTANNYTITFENEDHSVLQNTAFAYGSTPVYSGATPTKAETAQYTYTFAGWTPAITTVTGAATYTATYNQTVRSYTVTFVRNGHGSTNPASQLVEYGSKVTDPVYDVANYDVEGWYDDAIDGTKWNFATDVVTGPLTLYAHWVGETYNITYKDRGNTDFSGTHEPGYPTTHTYGTATTLDTPTKTGYTFYGWYYASEGGSKLSGSPASVGATTKTEDFTLYAQWTANTYTVAYNANGGTGSMSNSSHTYDVAKNLTANRFTKTGYTFSGWNTAADGSGMAYTDGQSVINLTVTSGATVTLYAQWTINQYNVTYHHAGADHVEAVNYNANPTGFTPDECSADRVFVGWSETEVATQQAEPTLVDPTDFTITAAKHFYAVYASKNGGKPSGETHNLVETFESYSTSTTYSNQNLSFSNPETGLAWRIDYGNVTTTGAVNFFVDSKGVILRVNGTNANLISTVTIDDVKSVSAYISANDGSTSADIYKATTLSDANRLTAQYRGGTTSSKGATPWSFTFTNPESVRLMINAHGTETKYVYIDQIVYTIAERSYTLTDYATSCDLATPSITWVDNDGTLADGEIKPAAARDTWSVVATPSTAGCLRLTV